MNGDDRTRATSRYRGSVVLVPLLFSLCMPFLRHGDCVGKKLLFIDMYPAPKSLTLRRCFSAPPIPLLSSDPNTTKTTNEK